MVREAKLFIAGDYPDKGVQVSTDDLDSMVKNFSEVPLKLNHKDTPLDGVLGSLKEVWRRGSELWGKIDFADAMWTLTERAGAKALSISMPKDKSKITEVSLVTHPRIEGAMVFDDSIRVQSPEIVFEEEVKTPMDENKRVDSLESSAVEFSKKIAEITAQLEKTQEVLATKEKQIEQLQFDNKLMTAKTLLAKYKAEGKIVPAVEDVAMALLTMGEENVTFSDGTVGSVRTLFSQYLEKTPAVVKFGEEEGKDAEGSESQTYFSADDQDFFSKLGLTNEDVAKYATR